MARINHRVTWEEPMQDTRTHSPKHASTDHPVHELIARRWSPFAFVERPVAAEDLRALFEAARWAASSFNEQPWSFIVATRDDAATFERVAGCLTEKNQAWARRASALVLTVIRPRLARNDRPNRVALHDLGLAVGNLTVEATSRGLAVHQMAGVDRDEARRRFGVPDDHEVVTAIAIGSPAEPAEMPDDYRERDSAPRQRKPLGEFVFGRRWGETAGLVA
jgi:nitroreductase